MSLYTSLAISVTLLRLPAALGWQGLLEMLQGQVHGMGIITEGSMGTTSEGISVDKAGLFEDDCRISQEVSGLIGQVEVDCNTAAVIADLVHRNCAEDLACRHPFFSDLEKQTKLVSNNVQHASRACVMASFLLEPDGIVVGSMDPEYQRLTQINWSKDCWLEPRCIVQPTSTAQVQRIMKIINRTSAPFAIRSGGHNPNCGWASIGNEGVLVDLSRLNHVEISENALTANIGPGNRWIDVYKKFDGSGRTVLGGRTPDVGVGGLLLGGGIPSFSSQFGFACDHVRRYEVVLSNGTVVTADRKGNQDLWWALKGGGSNFGIITQFELETVPVDRIWYESRIYEPRESLRLLEAVREYQVAAEADEKASFAFSLSNNHTIVAFIYSAPEAYPAVFNMFYDIPFRQNFIEPSFGTPYSLAAAFEQVLGNRPSFKRDIIAVSTKPDLSLYRKSYERWLQLSEEMLSKFDCMMTFGIQPITSSTIRKSIARGGNPMNLNLRPESQQWYTSVIQWQDDRFDDLAHEFVVRSGGAVRELAHENNLLLEFEFMNDASWHQRPIQSYGQANVNRLLEISRRYDPSRVFQKLQGGGFLLLDYAP